MYLLEMKAIKLLLGLLLLATITFAQTKNPLEVLTINTIGKNLKTQQDIPALRYVFSERIYNFQVDTINQQILVILRKLTNKGSSYNLYGTLLVVDGKTHQEKWNKKIDYSVEKVSLFSSFILHSKGKKYTSLDLQTGKELWSVKTYMMYCQVDKRIGVGYQNSGFASKFETLEGIDLTKGTVIWQRNFINDYGINSYIPKNDSLLLIKGGGLHQFNLADGKGWDYDAITGKKDYQELVAKNVLGVTLAVVTGVGFTANAPTMVSDIESNLLADKEFYYLASKNQLSKINQHNGTIVWSQALPEEETSKSVLFLKDSMVYIINKGYAYWGSKQIDFGIPYIAAFHQDTGKKEYLYMMDKAQSRIYDYQLKNDSILFMYPDCLSWHSLKDGAELLSKKIALEKDVSFSFNVGEYAFTQQQQKAFNLNAQNKNYYYFKTNNDKIVTFNEHFDQVNQNDLANFYRLDLKYKSHRFLTKEDETILMDENNNIVAQFNFGNRFWIKGTSIYVIDEHMLTVIPIAGFID